MCGGGHSVRGKGDKNSVFRLKHSVLGFTKFVKALFIYPPGGWGGHLKVSVLRPLTANFSVLSPYGGAPKSSDVLLSSSLGFFYSLKVRFDIRNSSGFRQFFTRYAVHGRGANRNNGRRPV